MSRPTPRLRWLLFLPALAFLALFYFYPLVRIGFLSFFPEGTWQPGQLDRLFTSPVYGRILWFTLWQAALSTVLTLCAALPAAYVFARYRFFGKGLVLALMTVPFVLPTVVTAAAFRALLGPRGMLNGWLMAGLGLDAPPIRIDQTIWFFLLAHVFYNYALVVRIVGGYWAGLDARLGAAAAMLGASPRATFLRITLPLLLPAIGSASLLVFIFCFTSFGVVLILGGPGYATLEVEIYRQAIQLFNLPMAATLSLIQLAANFLLMWLHARLSAKAGTGFGVGPGIGLAAGAARGSEKNAETLPEKLVLRVNLAFMTCLLAAPLVALVLQSFSSDQGLTLDFYRALFASPGTSVFLVKPIAAVANSLGFALLAMVFAVALGLAAAIFLAAAGRRASFWDALVMLPLATSAVTLGFGYIVALNRPPLDLRTSLALVPIAHTLVAFPFAVRCILPSLRQIPDSLREAATLLGASPAQVLRHIDLPLVLRAILVGAVFAFSISMGEFGASSFVARPQAPTMPVAIFRFLGQPGELNYGQAMAMSTILMLATCLGFWLIGRLDARGRRTAGQWEGSDA